jgi:hypothetical protein
VVRKITHILLVFTLFFTGMVSVAPMAFCQMTEAKQDVPDCCEKPEAKDTHCSPDTETTCPVCTQNICNSDASPQIKLSVEPNTSSVVLLAAMLPTDVLSTVYGSTAHQITANILTDSGPPIYLSNQVFRL